MKKWLFKVRKNNTYKYVVMEYTIPTGAPPSIASPQPAKRSR